jgi:hypothetical protein
MTATSEGSSATVGHSTFIEFEPMESTGVATAGSVATAAVSFEALAAAGYGPMFVDCRFETLSAVGVARSGTVAEAAILFRPLEATGVNRGGSIAYGTGVFQAGIISADGIGPGVSAGQSTFQRLTARAVALVGTAGIGAAEFEPLEASAASQSTNIASGAASFQYLRGYGTGAAIPSEVYRTWVLNTGNEALTEYQNYPFNSLAEFNGTYYGAGPGGVRQLEGVDDLGADIEWSFRTGLLDNKNPQLKRMDEVLLAMRFDGPVRVTVWTDDDLHFDYNVSNFRPGVVHQVRAKPGKGLRSRYYRVGLAGVGNTAAEIGAMQLPMIPLRRRLG